jgi:hypothetical protein
MILYKYLTVGKADEWLIGKDAILATPPIYLNDLLEARFSREPAGLEERRKMFEGFQRDSPSALSFEEYDRSIMRSSFMEREPEDMRKMLSERFGVVSLTEDPLSHLMWAHYGQNMGVAIGYSSDEPLALDGITSRRLPLGVALKVQYNDNAVVIKEDFSDAARGLTTKRSSWAYEKEWRIVQPLQDGVVTRPDGKRYALPAHRERVASVVFGPTAEPEFIERVNNWLQGCPAVRQQVRIDALTGNFALSDIETLN